MTHNLGRLQRVDRLFDETEEVSYLPTPGRLGPIRFVILKLAILRLSRGAQLVIEGSHGVESFSADAGASVWTRPINPTSVDGSARPISLRIVGGSGSVRLLEIGLGEPTVTGTPGGRRGSQTNPDVFLQDLVYAEPTYESRLECTPGFAWRNAAQPLPGITPEVQRRVDAATGIMLCAHDGHLSSCSGTLIGADLFLTAGHCLNDPSGEDGRSASVSFNYATDRDGQRWPDHVTRFFKVSEVVLAPSVASLDDWVILRLDAAPGMGSW